MNRRIFLGWLLKAAVAAPAIPAILEAATKVLPVRLSGALNIPQALTTINQRLEAKALLKAWMSETIDEEIMLQLDHQIKGFRGDRITFTKIRPLRDGEGRG